MQRAFRGFACLLAALMWASAAHALNKVEILTFRVSSAESPAGWFAEVFINLLDESGVTDVALDIDGTPVALSQEFPGDSEWEAELEYANLSAMTTALDGVWTIAITSDAPSVSTFTFNATNLGDGDYLQAATNLSPAEGATDVAPGSLLSWTAPTGGDSAFVLFTEVEQGAGGEFQEDDSLMGGLTISDITWQPPLTLFPGANDFAVNYLNGVDPAAPDITALNVTSGSIVWGNSEYAPPGWPAAATPLATVGSVAEVVFTTVPLVEDFEAYALQTDAIGPDYQVVDSMGDVIASANGTLVTSTGVADDSGNNIWQLDSPSGSTGTSSDSIDGFVINGQSPGAGVTTAGPIADFVANPCDLGRSLFNSSIRASVRETTQSAATQFRMVVTDSDGNLAATFLIPLTSTFQVFEESQSNFFDLAGGTVRDQIVGLSFEFFTDPAQAGTPPAFIFQIDDVEIVPEPASSLLGISALASLALIARARRRRRS